MAQAARLRGMLREAISCVDVSTLQMSMTDVLCSRQRCDFTCRQLCLERTGFCWQESADCASDCLWQGRLQHHARHSQVEAKSDSRIG